jgi:hypothetical protein
MSVVGPSMLRWVSVRSRRDTAALIDGRELQLLLVVL